MPAGVRDVEVERTVRGTELAIGTVLAMFCVRVCVLLLRDLEMSASSVSSSSSFSLTLTSLRCTGRVKRVSDDYQEGNKEEEAMREENEGGREKGREEMEDERKTGEGRRGDSWFGGNR